MPADRAWIEAVCRALASAGNPERAAGQQRYMKSAMPYHGITSAELTRLLRPFLTEERWRLPSRTTWEDTARSLWDNASHREQRYAVQALLRHRTYRAWQDPQLLPLLQHCISTGAWWDHVDDLASHHVGSILLQHRETVTPTMREWMVADDLWLRRSAIISQLGHKERTDTTLLADAIAANLDRDSSNGTPATAYGNSFWIRKAIGWALRQHAYTDPHWVRDLVAEHETRFSGLTRREALKHLR